MVHPVLFIYAHPDDETFSVGGTMAVLRERGIPVTLVCATRGDVGQISEASLATAETLAEVREQELRTAVGTLGVTDVRFLDYRDSGMEGTSENDDPRALVQQPREVVAERLAAVIRELQPSVIGTFGADGFYGHPDHIYIHEVTVDAVHRAAENDGWRISGLYFSSTPRERMQERAQKRQGPFKDMAPERLAVIGTPRAEITTVFDLADYGQKKWDAMMAHRTQFGERGPMSELPRDEVMALISREHFVRATLPWSPQPGVPDPLAEIEATLGTVPL